MPASSLACQLGNWIAEVRLENIPETTREKVRGCMLDWLGSAYAGSSHPSADQYLAVARNMGGHGSYDVVGRRTGLPLSMAVFVNGVFGHIAETDDGHRTSILHPGAVVFPVLMALAPDADDPGRAFLEGAVAGYELVIRVGEALGKDHYATWHTTSTAGIFGAAAAAAKVLNLSAEQCAAALGHAGTQASGLWQFLDDECLDAKPFHPGKAAMEGLLAALMAKENLHGAPRIFEGDKGLLKALARPAQPEKLIAGLGTCWKIDESNFKAYPTCGQTHSMIDALDTIVREHDPDPAHIVSIEARVYQRAIQIAGISDPQNLEEAKFSIAFCLAHYLRHKRLPFTGMSQLDVRQPETRAIMDKVSLVFDKAMDDGFPAARPCTLVVTMDDGRVFTALNLHRKGDPENPVDYATLADKFRELTHGVIDRFQCEAFIKGIHLLPVYKGLPPLYAGLC